MSEDKYTLEEIKAAAFQKGFTKVWALIEKELTKSKPEFSEGEVVYDYRYGCFRRYQEVIKSARAQELCEMSQQMRDLYHDYKETLQWLKDFNPENGNPEGMEKIITAFEEHHGVKNEMD